MVTTRIRVTYEDDHVEYLTLAESAFGLEGTRAHGPVRRVTPVTEYESDGGPVASGRASRSLVREARRNAA